MNFKKLSFANFFYLIPRLIIYIYLLIHWKCLKFDFKVGDATRRAQKRESCSPPWRPCRCRRGSNPIALDRAQKVGPETCLTQPCMCIIS